MIRRALRAFLPDRRMNCPILAGPFRGGRVQVNPRNSLRKLLGLYEHELNPDLRRLLPAARAVYDVGANDGYFTFGCVAWFARHRVAEAKVYAFEPQAELVGPLQAAANATADPSAVVLTQAFVGRAETPGTITLDGFVRADASRPRTGALVKIDVEGAEADVLAGATELVHPGNSFVIEIHSRGLIDLVSSQLRAGGLTPRLVEQRPHRILGRERRAVDNWWLVAPA